MQVGSNAVRSRSDEGLQILLPAWEELPYESAYYSRIYEEGLRLRYLYLQSRWLAEVIRRTWVVKQNSEGVMKL